MNVELNVLAAWLALILVIPALLGTLFVLRVNSGLRWIFVFFLSLGVWGVFRMAFWDILPSLFHLQQWENFAIIFHGTDVNTALNLFMAGVSAVHLWHIWKVRKYIK